MHRRSGKGRRRALRAAAALLGGSFALQALALGLGEPSLRSAPGEPLDLSIPVLCGAEECEHFEAALGGSADYRAARVPLPQLRGQLVFGYDRALEAIRIRTSAPLPAQDLHLLLELHAGSASLRQDVTVVIAAAPPAPQAAPAVAAPPAAAAAPAPATANTALAPVAPAAAAAPAAAPAPAHQSPAPASGNQAISLLKSLDPAQLATGLGVGAGLLLAWLLIRFLHEVFSHWSGLVRYRWAERKRERRREAGAEKLPPAAPLPRRPAQAQPGGPPPTPELRDATDLLARQLRQQIDAEPQRLDLRLKLAERLFVLKDGEAYTDLVLSLKPLLKDQAWERLRRMGQQLRPYDDRFLNLADRGTADTVPLIKSDY